jgi:hypothetical protein
VAVRHGGLHVLAGRVNAFGKVWRESRDYARAMAAVRVIERDRGLVPVEGPGRRRRRRVAGHNSAGDRTVSPVLLSRPGPSHPCAFHRRRVHGAGRRGRSDGLTTTGYVGEAALAAARGVSAEGETHTGRITRAELAALQRELFATRTALTQAAADLRARRPGPGSTRRSRRRWPRWTGWSPGSTRSSSGRPAPPATPSDGTRAVIYISDRRSQP